MICKYFLSFSGRHLFLIHTRAPLRMAGTLTLVPQHQTLSHHENRKAFRSLTQEDMLAPQSLHMGPLSTRNSEHDSEDNAAFSLSSDSISMNNFYNYPDFRVQISGATFTVPHFMLPSNQPPPQPVTSPFSPPPHTPI